ncbi:hypothetical protein IC582_025831 [Cucumis melo]
MRRTSDSDLDGLWTVNHNLLTAATDFQRRPTTVRSHPRPSDDDPRRPTAVRSCPRPSDGDPRRLRPTSSPSSLLI